MADEEITTYSVLRSKPVARADGRAAIVLDLTTLGPIAIELNLLAIESLRQQLAQVERLLRQESGKA